VKSGDDMYCGLQWCGNVAWGGGESSEGVMAMLVARGKRQGGREREKGRKKEKGVRA
jgi:hypothetical protein